jgi:predicted TPR repeat methyltransferase
MVAFASESCPWSNPDDMQATPAADSQRTLRQAMQDHGAGRLSAAQVLYQQVLESEPDNADALHLLGVLRAQSGDHEAAAELIGRAVAINPAEPMFHNNLGNVLVERSRFDEAEASYMRAIELDPGRVDALNNLGVLLGRRGQAEGAEKLLLKVIEVAPDFADARQNLANHYLRVGRLSEAVQQCFDGLIVAPRSTALRRVLGMAYTTMGMKDEAIAVYRRWLDDEPGNPLAEFHLNACTGADVPARAPDAYVRSVFDAFARSFDAKLASLSYRAPEFVAGMLARLAGAPAKALDIVDAGCGTGLCGPLVVPHARRLDGVDLSDGMLAKARARGVYDELVAAELVAFLDARPTRYDAVVSADTLCYFGALEPFARAARTALRDGGLLVFTVEALVDEAGAPPFKLHEHGRYSHRLDHVDAALAGAGFTRLDAQAVVLRMEAGAPVDGWLVGARAGGAN